MNEGRKEGRKKGRKKGRKGRMDREKKNEEEIRQREGVIQMRN